MARIPQIKTDSLPTCNKVHDHLTTVLQLFADSNLSGEPPTFQMAGTEGSTRIANPNDLSFGVRRVNAFNQSHYGGKLQSPASWNSITINQRTFIHPNYFLVRVSRY